MFKYDKYAIGNTLRELRKEHNFTQSEVAERLELSVIHYSLIEQGQRKFSLDVLYRMMRLFDVNADRILSITPVQMQQTDDIKETDIAFDLHNQLLRLEADEQDYIMNVFMIMIDGLISRKEGRNIC